MNEATIVKNILRHLSDREHCYARKTHGGPHSPGWPDLIVCLRGHFLALEVKRPGGKLTALQAHELERWARAGATAAVVTCWEDVRAILDRLPC